MLEFWVPVKITPCPHILTRLYSYAGGAHFMYILHINVTLTDVSGSLHLNCTQEATVANKPVTGTLMHFTNNTS